MKGDKIFQLNDYSHHPKGYNDMVEMENLSEAELLYNLRLRYANDMIFTYVGPTLIVLNPYRMIQPLFTPELVKEFQDTVKQEKFIHKEHIPHVFAIAASTLTNMFVNKRNQAVVIAGESGAGKTENTKFCMKFLTSFGESESESDKSISDKVLHLNNDNKINRFLPVILF
jgi:Myosin heavy chain